MSEGNQEIGLVATWAEAQQKVLVGWLDLVQGMEGPSRMAAWNETVKAWQTAVQETLDAQARWLRDWTARPGHIGKPDRTAEECAASSDAALALDRGPTAPLAELVLSRPAPRAAP